MNNAIRHTWIVSVALFASLFVALSVIQVVVTDELGQNPNNSRQIIQDRGAPRGPITVDGSPIAESVAAENSAYDYQRVYHDSDVYSGITGFFSVHEAPTGIESQLNEYLIGRSDSQFLDRVTSLFTGETMEGAQVELTVDGELQHLAHDLIPDGYRGSIVVMNVQTGEVEAMAAKPTYDANDLAVHGPNAYREARAAIQEASDDTLPYYFGPTRQPIYPGSTFKLIDAVAMLESGDYEPDTELENPDSIELPGTESTLTNYFDGGCHEQSEAEFTWIFAQSCNTPFAEAALELGDDTIREVAERFGWNQPLSIPLVVEASHFPEELNEPQLAHSAIGQFDVTATPLQMTMVSAAIANGGTQMRPQLIDTIRGSDLQILSQPEPEVLNNVMDSSIADDITEMMVETVETGTAWRAQTGQFEVAAKTGTSEMEGTDQVNAWITGFAPADDPQYAVTVVYEEVPLAEGPELTGPQMLTLLEAVVEE